MRKEFRIQLFIALNIVVAVLAILSIYIVEGMKPIRMNDNNVNVLGKSVNNIKEIPFTHNLAPHSVAVGSVYDYTINIFTEEQHYIITEVNVLPQWLNVDNNRVFGIPTIKDIGTHQLIYNINIDGQNFEYKTNILVYERDEE